MALIKCYNCSKEISDTASICPHCKSFKLKKCYECSKNIDNNLYPCPYCGAQDTLNNQILSFIEKNKLLTHLSKIIWVYLIFNFFLFFLFYSSPAGPINLYGVSLKEFFLFLLYFSISSWWIKLPICLFLYFSCFKLIDGEGGPFTDLWGGFCFCFMMISLLFFLYFGIADKMDWTFNSTTFSVDKVNDNFFEYMLSHPLLWVILSSSMVISLIMYYLDKIRFFRSRK
jgi:hypothetical protein